MAKGLLLHGLQDLFSPAREVLKGLLQGDVIDQCRGPASPVKPGSHDFKAILARHIPDAELHCTLREIHSLGLEFDPDGLHASGVKFPLTIPAN